MSILKTSYPEFMGRKSDAYVSGAETLYRKSMIVLDQASKEFKIKHESTGELYNFGSDNGWDLSCHDRSIRAILLHDILKEPFGHEKCSCGHYSFFEYEDALKAESTDYTKTLLESEKFYNLGYVLEVSAWYVSTSFTLGIKSRSHRVKKVITGKCFDSDCSSFSVGFIVDEDNILLASCLDHIKEKSYFRNLTFPQFDTVAKISSDKNDPYIDHSQSLVKSIDEVTNSWASVFNSDFPNSKISGNILRALTSEPKDKTEFSFNNILRKLHKKVIY